MNIYESFSMAMKNIRSNKVRSILTMLGIIIGVAAVIVITGLGNGMENYMRDAFASMGTNNLTVFIWGRADQKMNIDDMQAIVDKNSDIFDKMSPEVSFQGSMKVGTETMDSTRMTYGVNEQYIDINNYKISKGRNIEYFDMKNRNSVCLIGNYVNLKYFGGKGLGEKIKINGRNFTVIGILEEKGDSSEYSADDCLFMPYTTLCRMLNIRDADYFTVTFRDEDKAAESKQLLQSELQAYFKNDDNAFYVQSMAEMLDQMNSMTSILITILTLIAGISLVVGGIGIMNIMLVSVTERTKEIGIRKALGAKERYIMNQFVIEAAATSALGGVIGIGLGYVLSFIFTQVIYQMFQQEMTVAPTLFAVMVSFGISAGIGILFGYMPAKKAARLNPIDALRYD